MDPKVLSKKIRVGKPLFIVFAAALFIILLYIYLSVSQKTERGIFGFNDAADRHIDLKLSSDDLISLNDRAYTQWINVKLIESEKKSYRIKIRPLPNSVMDFQLNADETVYNLFKLSDRREPVYRLFKQAGAWELRHSSPVPVRLKINAVLIGTYLMEEAIYEQLRDENHNFFIRLSTDTLRMRKLRYEVEHGYNDTLKKYFDKKEVAAYLVFYSLFSSGTPGSPLRLDRLVFRFDAGSKKFRPYLTLESILSGVDEEEELISPKITTKTKGDPPILFSRENIETLIKKSRKTPYVHLIDVVFKGITFKKKKGIQIVKWKD